jgi:serine/threonine-protein kinase ULK4
LWIILEYCSGADLLQLIEKDKKIPENVIRSFGVDLIKGLMYMHSKGIIYCDMKPSNILINEYGNLKYGDFGLSKKLVDLI